MYYSRLILWEQSSSIVEPFLNAEALRQGFFCVMNAKQCHAISCERACETVWQLILMAVLQHTQGLCMLLLIPGFQFAFLFFWTSMWVTCLTGKARSFHARWHHQIIKWPLVVKEEIAFLYLLCSMKCLALISTWWPTFCVSLWAKTGSLTLMFNSAIVFDERFCLDCDPQGGTSVANLAYILYLWKKVGWNNKCQVWVWACSHKKYLVFHGRWRKAGVSAKQTGPFSASDTFFWMRRASEWRHYEIT